MTQARTPLSNPNNAHEYEAELKFKALSFPTRVDATTWEILECLKTGLFRNQAVESVALFSISGEEEAQVFVYNIEAAKSGNQPWSLQCQAV